jgi:hypothetical protein
MNKKNAFTVIVQLQRKMDFKEANRCLNVMFAGNNLLVVNG